MLAHAAAMATRAAVETTINHRRPRRSSGRSASAPATAGKSSTASRMPTAISAARVSVP